MKNSDFDFDIIYGICYEFHKKKLNYGGLNIDCINWIKKAIINSKSTENNCFQYAVKVAVDHENIQNHLEINIKNLVFYK